MTWVEIANAIRTAHTVSARAAMRLAHGWTQHEAAERWSMLWPNEPKDKKNFSYWERWPLSGRAPSLEDLLKLAKLYQCSVPDLLVDLQSFRDLDPAFAKPLRSHALASAPLQRGDPNASSQPTPMVPWGIEPTLADSLLATLKQHVVTENLVGARPLLSVVSSESSFIEQQLLAARSERGRAKLLYVAARFAEFLGWLHQDSGDLRSALHWSTMGLEFAEACGDPALAAYIWMRKSNISTDARKPDLALAFIGSAMTEASRLPPQLRAVLLRQAAHAYALRGDADACRRSLDNAMTEAVESANDDGLANYCTPNYVEMEAAQCFIELGRTQEAVDTLRRGRQGWKGSYRRDLGLCLARLAAAYAANAEPSSAIAAATEALAFGVAVSSHRVLDQIERVPLLLADGGATEEALELQTLFTQQGIASHLTAEWRMPTAYAHLRHLD